MQRTRERSGIRNAVGAALAGVLCIGSGVGCGSDTGADPGATAVPVGNDGTAIAATKDGITAYILVGDYTIWGKEPGVRDAIRSHGGRARSYFNDKYLRARRSETYPMELGATAVKELYDGDRVYGYAVAVKTQRGAGAETWTWYETTGLPDVKYFGVANPTCEGCHAGDQGRDRSLAPTVP